MEKVLVTGGAGFIGSHLVESLLEDKKIICLDDFNDFYDPRLKEENISTFKGHKNFTLVRGDIRDLSLVDNLFEREKPDVVVHLAARAGVRPSLEKPHTYEKTNVAGTLNLLEASRHSGLKKFIFGSSSSVYGMNTKVPFQEGDPLLNPLSPYAATKIAGEALCNSYAHLYQIPTISLRFFTVYGPRQRPDLAIRKFARRMLKGEEITLYGDGHSARDYTYVEDIIQGVKASLDYPLQGHEIFNLGNSYPVKLIELVEMLEEAMGLKARIRWEKDQPGDVPITYADLTRSRKFLNYNPSFPLQEGLKIFVEWMRGREK